MKQPKLKAFLISYSYAEYDYLFKQGKGTIKNLVIIARYEKEAIKKLMEHLTINLLYKEENIVVFSVQRLRKTKKNAHWYTQEYYDKQEYVLKHYDEYKERNNKQ